MSVRPGLAITGQRILWTIVVLTLATSIAAALQADRVGLRLLVVGTETEAADLRSQIEGGATFQVIARDHSVDPSATSGGYLGTFALSDLRPEYQDALRGLAPGEVSPVASIDGEYFLFQLLSEDEENWIAAREEGLRAFQRGSYAQSLESYEIALEAAERFGLGDSRLGESLDDLAGAHYLQGNYGDAVSLYRRSMLIRWARPSADPLPDVGAMLEDFTALLSLAYFRGEAFDQARKDYGAAIRQMPLTEDLYTAMTSMFSVAELAEEAEMVLLEAVEAFPDSRLLRYDLGQQTVLLGKPIQALEVFRAANAIDQNSGDSTDQLQRSLIYRGIGDLHVELFQYDDAFEAYQEAVELDPSSVDVHLSLVDIYLSRDEFENALAELEYALSLDPNNVQAYSGLAQVHLKSGRFEESLAAAEKALEIDPTTYSTHFFAARAMIRLGMREEGREEMRRYQQLLANTEQGDDDIRTLSRRAGELALSGEGPEAIAALESLIETYPNQVLPRLNLGITQRELGLHQAAIDTFQTMVEEGLDGVMVQRNLAVEYEALGDVQARDRHQAAFFQRMNAFLTEMANYQPE